MEVKKAKWLKFISAIAIFVVMIFCTGLNVHAEDVKDGILVTVSSDKENYNSEDEVNLKITVKNTNDFEVSDIKVENILPDGISLVSGDISKDNINLKANEESTMNLTVKKANSGQADITDNTTNNVSAVGKSDTTSSSNGKIPNTGENDTPLIAMIVMIISIVIMIICFWKGRKKHLKFLSLFVCLGVVGTFGITGITHAVSDNTQTETINSSDENISSFTAEFTYVIDNVNYTNNTTITYYTIDFYIFCDTNKKIEETMDNDVFESKSLDEKKEIVLTLLNKLENENRIKKGSIKFNEEYNSYFFEYINGGECSVLLESFSSEEKDDIFKPLSIYDNIDTSYIPSYNRNVYIDTFTLKNKYNYDINKLANGYIKSILSNNNLDKNEKTALIIDEIPADRFIRNFQKEIWSSNGLKTTIKQDVTVEDCKIIFNGYDFIDFIGHGYVDYNNNPNICLQENQSFLDITMNGKIAIKYYDDIKLKRVGILKEKNGVSFYLTSKFFSYYYKNKLSNTIVWISSCSGYSNDTLVGALANECNAKAVIGATDIVATGYAIDMADVFVHKLLFGFTVDEALKEAQSLYGNNDDEWLIKLGEKSDNTPAEFKVYNGGNETLVDLFPVEVEEYGTLSGTVIDESGNPVENADVLAINIRGRVKEAITGEDGRFIINDCPVDSYQIEVSAEGYELYQSDEFLSTDYVVLEGQEPKSVTIQLKKLKEYTEDDLKEKVISESNGNIVAWVYEDFDGNGTKEAFAVIDNGAEDAPKIQSIYFIDNKGNTKEMRNTFDYPAYDDSKYTICQGKGFFSVDVFGSGSAWKTYLFSVKDNNAYELDISGDLQGFYERNGYFYTLNNNHGNQALEYPEIELIYNSDTQQFTKGQRTLIELKNYLGTSLLSFIENENGMYDVGATSAVEYKNDYLIVSASMLSKDIIDFFEITNNCNYSIHGVYYGMSMEEASNMLLQSSIKLSEDLPNYKYFDMNDGTRVSIRAENEKIVNICIWASDID